MAAARILVEIDSLRDQNQPKAIGVELTCSQNETQKA
jgi:hypothetical protein